MSQGKSDLSAARAAVDQTLYGQVSGLPLQHRFPFVGAGLRPIRFS